MIFSTQKKCSAILISVLMVFSNSAVSVTAATFPSPGQMDGNMPTVPPSQPPQSNTPANTSSQGNSGSSTNFLSDNSPLSSETSPEKLAEINELKRYQEIKDTLGDYQSYRLYYHNTPNNLIPSSTLRKLPGLKVFEINGVKIFENNFATFDKTGIHDIPGLSMNSDTDVMTYNIFYGVRLDNFYDGFRNPSNLKYDEEIWTYWTGKVTCRKSGCELDQASVKQFDPDPTDINQVTSFVRAIMLTVDRTANVDYEFENPQYLGRDSQGGHQFKIDKVTRKVSGWGSFSYNITFYGQETDKTMGQETEKTIYTEYVIQPLKIWIDCIGLAMVCDLNPQPKPDPVPPVSETPSPRPTPSPVNPVPLPPANSAPPSNSAPNPTPANPVIPVAPNPVMPINSSTGSQSSRPTAPIALMPQLAAVNQTPVLSKPAGSQNPLNNIAAATPPPNMWMPNLSIIIDTSANDPLVVKKKRVRVP